MTSASDRTVTNVLTKQGVWIILKKKCFLLFALFFIGHYSEPIHTKDVVFLTQPIGSNWQPQKYKTDVTTTEPPQILSELAVCCCCYGCKLKWWIFKLSSQKLFLIKLVSFCLIMNLWVWQKRNCHVLIWLTFLMDFIWNPELEKRIPPKL